MTTHLFIFDNLAYLFIFSLLLGIPAGSIYSSSLYSANSGGHHSKEEDQDGKQGADIKMKEREMAVNILFMAMDFGSLVAQGVAAYL